MRYMTGKIFQILEFHVIFSGWNPGRNPENTNYMTWKIFWEFISCQVWDYMTGKTSLGTNLEIIFARMVFSHILRCFLLRHCCLSCLFQCLSHCLFCFSLVSRARCFDTVLTIHLAVLFVSFLSQNHCNIGKLVLSSGLFSAFNDDSLSTCKVKKPGLRK